MSLYKVQLADFDYQDINAEFAEVRESGAAVFYNGPRIVAAFATGMWVKFREEIAAEGGE